MSHVTLQIFKILFSIHFAEFLENLINQALLFQASKEQGIRIEEDAITSQLQKIKQRFPSETEFKNTVKKFQ